MLYVDYERQKMQLGIMRKNEFILLKFEMVIKILKYRKKI